MIKHCFRCDKDITNEKTFYLKISDVNVTLCKTCYDGLVNIIDTWINGSE
jgi:hypothetical protein